MKLITINICLLIILSLFSCKKDISIHEEDSITPAKLYIVWHKSVFDDNAGAIFDNPYFSNNYVGFSAKLLYDKNDGKLGAVLLNKLTGDRHPAWNHEPNISDYIPDWDIAGEDKGVVVYNNSFFLSLYSVNTGEEIPEFNPAPNMIPPRISTFGNIVFMGISPHGNDVWGELGAFNVKTRTYKEIIHLDMIDGYEFTLLPPSVYIAASNDTILIFQKRQYNFFMPDGKVDIYAYNMTADSLLWIIDDITISGNSSVKEGIIVNDKYIFQGSNSVHCINILNGTILWEHQEVGGSFFQQDNLYAEGKIFMNSEGGKVFCYDINSGNLLWENTTSYSNPSRGGRMVFYNGKLYINVIPDERLPLELRGSLKCYSGNTGELLWSSVNSSGGLIVDNETGYLYTTNEHEVFCIDLNKSPIKD